ncbi:unnamed protein product [Amoebophrya sp. A120]|nr:unnamed protein product [Amoebophrya sp. A120]|eukprot:GSA120T00013067001.1
MTQVFSGCGICCSTRPESKASSRSVPFSKLKRFLQNFALCVLKINVAVVLRHSALNAHIKTAHAWPRDAETFRQLRYARRASFMRYKNPGYADQVLWFPLCDEQNANNCDWYTYGSSQCIFHTKMRNNTKKEDTVLLNSNCQLRSDKAGPFYFQLFHCPRNLPIAAFVLPKSGTTSSLNWLLEHEDVWPTLSHAAENMRLRPQDMMNWLSEEASWWVVDQETASHVANRVMHRWPADVETQMNAEKRLFLPPAHLCPLCCAKGHGRLRVFVARNPFVRLVSFYKYRWLQGYNDTMKEAEQNHESLFAVGTTKTATALPNVDVVDNADDVGTATSKNQSTGLFYEERGFLPGTKDRYYYSWKHFGAWVRKLLHFRSLQPFHKDHATAFQSREKAKKCEKSADIGAYHCQDFTFEFDASDIFHIRPLIDMLKDERFVETVGEEPEKFLFGQGSGNKQAETTEVDQSADSGEIFILHLETMKQDLEKLYDRICELYGRFCRAAENGAADTSPTPSTEAGQTTTTAVDPSSSRRMFVADDAGNPLEVTSDYVEDGRFGEYKDVILPRYNERHAFPKVYPTTNKRPEGANACDFDAKTLSFSADCLTTWGELWGEDGALAELVRQHYALDFALFGYSADPASVMPVEGGTDKVKVRRLLEEFVK